MHTDTLNLARVRAASIGRLRVGRDHHAAVGRWHERSLVHYHVTLSGVAVDNLMEIGAAANANTRMLAGMLPKGSRVVGMISGNVDDGKMTAVWCVRAKPGLKLPLWSGYVVERQVEDDGN